MFIVTKNKKKQNELLAKFKDSRSGLDGFGQVYQLS